MYRTEIERPIVFLRSLKNVPAPFSQSPSLLIAMRQSHATTTVLQNKKEGIDQNRLPFNGIWTIWERG